MLGDPGAFDIGTRRLAVFQQIVVVLTETLPAMQLGLEVEELGRLALVDQLAVVERNLDTVDREDVGAAPVQIPAPVIVLQQPRVPGSRRDVPRLHLLRISVVHGMRQGRHGPDEEVQLAGLGRGGNEDRPRARKGHGRPEY